MLACLAFALLSFRGANGGTAQTNPASSTNFSYSTNGGYIAYLTGEEEARTFVCEDGYSLELVLSDPIIKEPVLTVFDANGRMFVAEMRSYMQNVDGKGQDKRNGCVSVHWSSRHDGVYDKHAIFADHLLLPRMVLPLGDGVLINETDTDDLYLYRDTKGNGVADSKTLFYKGGRRGGNVEHQPGGIIMCMDNWIYMPVNAYRLRLKGTNVLYEPTPPNMGQWGLCQDDYGKPWFINAGSESGPLNFQAPVIYGIPNFDEQREPGWAVVWPLIGLADVQGGIPRFRPQEKSLNHFTSTCGDQIYRGDRLPADLRGDLLYAEPVGRLIRRDRVLDIEGLTRLHSVYTNSEFIRSTDPNFRPVNVANAPDGSIYITDMYRGIIQEKNWVTKNTYLRGVVEKYHLDKNVSRGRVWRLVHKTFTPGPQPQLLSASTPELVQTLAHPNGWWRDTAQQLIVMRDDKSCIPDLKAMALTNPNPLARIHALWTLEGLEAIDTVLLREAMSDADPKVRVAAIRVSESMLNTGYYSLVPDILKLAADPNPDVVVQTLLTASLVRWPNAQRFIERTVAGNQSLGVRKIGGYLIPQGEGNDVGLAQPGAGTSSSALLRKNPIGKYSIYSEKEHKSLKNGELIYKQLCFSCHGLDGKGTPFQGAQPGMTLAPAFSGSETVNGFPDGVVGIVLKGLSGPVDGHSYDAQMSPMENNDDEWISSVISYIRNNFGNHSSFVSVRDVARVRLATKDRQTPWTIPELENLKPVVLGNRALWKLTASHNAECLRLAVDGNLATRYDTGASQDPGMFVQIELPSAVEICGVQLDAGTANKDYPRSYKVQVSNDGKVWGEPLVSGSSAALFNQMLFSPVTTRFVRITQTGLDPVHHWSIAELNLLRKRAAGEAIPANRNVSSTAVKAPAAL